MIRHVVMVFEILCPVAPLEITGTVDGRPFYYRGRHERWGVYPGLEEYGNRRPPIASGNAVSGEEADLAFAMNCITLAFEPQINDVLYPGE
jgi:hypothetical protein